MANGSNRTDRGSATRAVQQTQTGGSVSGAVQAAQEMQPSITDAVRTSDQLDPARAETPKRPVGGPAQDVDLLDTIGRVAQFSPFLPESFGPEQDPQTRERTIEALESAGANVADAVKAAPGVAADVATDLPSRVPELATRASSVGFLAIPAGIERALLGQPTTEPGDPELAPEETVEVGGVPILKRPFQELVAAGQDQQEVVRNYFNNDESALVNLTADIAGGYKFASAAFRIAPLANKFVANRFSSALFRPLVSGQRATKALSKLPAPLRRLFTDPETAGTFASRTARTALASAEGGLFMAGLPDTDAQDIQLGVAGGFLLQGGAEVLGGFTTRYLRNKASRVFTDELDRLDELSGDAQIEGFPAFLARQESNLMRGAPFQQTSDEAIAGIKATLSESGDHGTLGVVRGMTDLTEESTENLRQAFPDYRFEVLGGPQVRAADEAAGFAETPFRGRRVRRDQINDQKLVFGLDPEVDLPEGTRDAPSLTDKVLEDFQSEGILRRQKVLVGGREHRFLSANAEGDRVLVKPLNRGQPYEVPRSRVTPVESSVGTLKNDRLLQQFRQFQSAENFRDLNRAYNEFWNRFLADDTPDALKRPLKRYFDEQNALLRMKEMRPDERRTVERFRAALRRFQQVGDEPQNLDTQAAERGFLVHHFSDGRKKLTNMRTGKTTDLFRNEDRVREYLRNIDYEDVDLTAGIPGVPDNLLSGTLQPTARPNPSVPSKGELEQASIMERIGGAASAFGNWWSKHVTRQIRSMEDAARVMQEKGVVDAPIWEDAMQPLSQRIREVQNRTRPFAEELSRILGGVDEADQDLIEGWLRSERKSVFESAHDMPDDLVRRAQETRFWLDEIFNEWSAATGLNLSPDDYLRNYAPSNIDWAAQTGRLDFEELWNARSPEQPLRDLNDFFGEMWKSGEAREMAQEPLASKLSRMLRSGMFKAHAGPEFQRAVNFARELENGSVGQRHLVQYLNGARGRVDFVRSRMDEVFSELYSELGMTVSEGNVSNVIDAAITQSYGGLIGFRPSLLARQLYQPLNLGGPILGNKRIVQAQRDALQDEHRAWARRVGILEEREAVTFFEQLDASPRQNSVFRLNQRARSLGLKPYSGFDKHNRVATALATKRNLEPQLRRFRAGEINETELLEQSGLWILDSPQRRKFFNVLDGEVEGTVGQTADERAVNFAADEIGSKLTNFLYGRQNAPFWMQTTFGRMFGAYSTWPRGYLNYITHLTSADVRPGIKAKALATHGANNLAVASAGQALGLNLSNWMPWNSLFFGGSPGWDQMVGMANAWGGAPWERGEATREFASQGSRMLFPGGQMLAGDILPAVLEDMEPSQRAASAAGFATPQDEDERMQILGGPFGFGVRANLLPEGTGRSEAEQGVEVETPFGDIGEP